MPAAEARFNPFPGLRPFGPDEDHLFFGREREIDELLRRLRVNRFLPIIGTSGCGKSSLIRCGLISSLHSGMMTRAGSSWRVSILRPGEDPLGHLAAALDTPDVIGARDQELASTNRVLVEAALRRGPRGLIDAVRHARVPAGDNVLVVVDQFEELFRFQRSRPASDARDEAVSFVKLLLEATQQSDVPIYVVITMRSDFIGDCMEYPGLPEALNAGQYLVPRMSRDALRSAITGPAVVAGGEIAPRLVRRLLNDLGTDHDQLPVLQHALMRTWDHWMTRSRAGEPVDIQDYEAVGTLHRALSLHAEEAYAEAAPGQGHLIAERIFKALTDTVTDSRGTRRPCTVAELTAVAGAQEEVVRVVEIFRRPGRSFLMPPPDVPLDASVIVDISHESLMRCWTRLIAWAEEERLSATVYLRLSRAAAWFEEGSAGLWRDPELELGLRWRRENQPTAAWARRYGEPFERAMQFLERSERDRDLAVAERRAEKRRQWRQLQWTAAMLAVLLLIAGTMAFLANRAGARARAENTRAEENLRLARAAVDASLAVAEREPSRLAADFPELVRFRQQLLDEAHRFYRQFVDQAPTDETLRSDVALATLRLAHIDRALASFDQAASGYRDAIGQLQQLVEEASRPEHRQALAAAYNWLGETLRLSAAGFDEALQAYVRALALQEGLVGEFPGNAEYRRDLARTHYNRGILHFAAIDGDNAVFQRAERDFRDAIDLLEPLSGRGGNPQATQELGRAYNNTGTLLATRGDRRDEALAPYTRAVQIHESLLKQEPENREYALELVKFYNNLGDLLRESADVKAAAARNRQALTLIETLSRPAPSLSIERADSYNLQGRILEAMSPAAALAEYRNAFEIYEAAANRPQTLRLADFHLRFGDLMVNLAFWVGTGTAPAGARTLLSEAVTFYFDLADRIPSSNARDEARGILRTLAALLPVLPEGIRESATRRFEELQPRLDAAAARES
jgi:tetratricopeptide (TPR) repeat protein